MISMQERYQFHPASPGGWSGAKLDGDDRLCVLTCSGGMRRLVVARFFKAGLAGRNKCLYLGNPRPERANRRPPFRDAVLARALAAGQLEIARDAPPFRDGGDGPEGAADWLEGKAIQALSEGYPGLMVVCDLEWLLGADRPAADLDRIRKAFGRLVRDLPCLVLCLRQPEESRSAGEGAAGRSGAAGTDDGWARRLGHALADSRQPFFIASGEGRLLTCNASFSRLTGYAETELTGVDWQERLAPGGRIEPEEAADEEAPLSRELVRRDGSRVQVDIWRRMARDRDGRPLWQCCFVHDATQSRQEAEALRFKACHDSLTMLPNRSLFMERLEHAIEQARRRSAYQFAVAFLDLDDFKGVNDRHGHAAGDRILVAAAERIKECLRGVDTLGRLGGDEFVLLLDDVDEAGALAVIERILAGFRRPVRLGHTDCPLSASVGLAPDGREYERPEEILRDADAAMYRAKRLGKNRCAVHGRLDSPRVGSRLWRDIGRALEKNEFLLLYQPVVSLKNRRLVGFEALLRWPRPGLGLLRPPQFLDVALDAGRGADIIRWTLHESCRQMARWAELAPASGLAVSVNVSGLWLPPDQILTLVDEALARTGLDRTRLRLEIKRGDFRRDEAALAEFMLRLKERGLHLTIDDFTAGCPGLSRLQQSSIVPVDAVKLDGAVVAALAADSRQADHVWTVAMLAQSLGIDVIAKGVETREQANRLVALKCEYGQGFYFSRPTSAKRAEAMIRRGAVC